MKLNTNKKAFSLEFSNGEVDYIYFNPNDRDFLRKVMDFGSSIKRRIENINLEKYRKQIEDGAGFKFNLNDFNSLKDMSEEDYEKLKGKLATLIDIDAELQSAIKAEMNELFKYDVSAVLFKYCEPLDSVLVEKEDGTEASVMFIIHFLEQFAVELKNQAEKLSPAANKYLEKYEI